MIEQGYVKPIEFEFYKGQKSKNPYLGLKNFKPYDLDDREFKNVEITLICPQSNKNYLNSFMVRLQDSFRDLFNMKCQYVIKSFSSKKDFDTILYSEDIKQKSPNSDSRKLILHYHAFFNEKFDAEYYSVKRHFLGMGLPTQGLLEMNLNPKPGGPYVNSVALGIYAKIGGRPWNMSGKISNILKGSTIYIGFDVSRKDYGRGTHSSPGCIVVYDENGQEVYHFTELIPIVNEIMEHDKAAYLMRSIIDRVAVKKGQEPDNVVFMRDGDINDEEIMGFEEALESREINLYILEFRKSGEIPILQKKGNNYEITDSGVYFTIQNHDPSRPIDIFVQTLGNDYNLSNLPRCVKFSPRLKTEKEFPKEDFARQILILSHLNWSSLKGRTKLPITVHYAHEAALLMESGINPKNIDDMKLWMI